MTKKLVLVPRGIPGSGKSTWAYEILANEPAGTVARINNDDIVKMTFGTQWRRQENIASLLQTIREQLLVACLTSPTINIIIIDNTNLAVRTVGSLYKIAQQYDAAFHVEDKFLTVPIELCISNDALREHPVTADVIRSMYKDANRLKPWKYQEPVTVQTYDNKPSDKRCYIIDIDGTLAIKKDRDRFDESRVGEDEPNEPVTRIISTLIADTISRESDCMFFFFTGRRASSYVASREWLVKNIEGLNGVSWELHTRRDTDFRPDWIVKHELFKEHISSKGYMVLGIFDDRDSVVNLWRNRLGLPTFQVANGDF